MRVSRLIELLQQEDPSAHVFVPSREPGDLWETFGTDDVQASSYHFPDIDIEYPSVKIGPSVLAKNRNVES